jgi:hypothetical protein
LLLDDFHVVDERLREIRDHLPRSYYRRLPKIAEGHLAGTPCVYGLAWAYAAHTDSRFGVETRGRFIRAYQRIQPLGLGDLWAVPSHLHIALVENLRRLSEQLIRARHARAKADKPADRLLGLSGRPAENTEDVLRPLDDTPWWAHSQSSWSSGSATRTNRSHRPCPPPPSTPFIPTPILGAIAADGRYSSYRPPATRERAARRRLTSTPSVGSDSGPAGFRFSFQPDAVHSFFHG